MSPTTTLSMCRPGVLSLITPQSARTNHPGPRCPERQNICPVRREREMPADRNGARPAARRVYLSVAVTYSSGIPDRWTPVRSGWSGFDVGRGSCVRCEEAGGRRWLDRTWPGAPGADADVRALRRRGWVCRTNMRRAVEVTSPAKKETARMTPADMAQATGAVIDRVHRVFRERDATLLVGVIAPGCVVGGVRPAPGGTRSEVMPLGSAGGGRSSTTPPATSRPGTCTPAAGGRRSAGAACGVLGPAAAVRGGNVMRVACGKIV